MPPNMMHVQQVKYVDSEDSVMHLISNQIQASEKREAEKTNMISN